MTDAAGRANGYVHDALLYDSPVELAGVAAPFLLDGLAAGDAAVVATRPATTELVREAVDGDPRVLVLDGSDPYQQRTPTTITTFRRLADRLRADGVQQVRVIGETDFGGTDQDRLEWQRYEAVINRALADWPLWGLCLFDTQRLPDPVLDAARRTHPYLVTSEGRTANSGYAEPADYLRSLPVPREPLEETAPRLSARNVSDFVALRHQVASALAAIQGYRQTTEDFLLSVDEMVSNAARHGRPPIDLSLWISPTTLVCSIRDSGQGLDDPFAGYGPAHGEDLSRGGMGLWLARQLCDHVDIRCGADGFTVRLSSRLR